MLFVLFFLFLVFARHVRPVARASMPAKCAASFLVNTVEQHLNNFKHCFPFMFAFMFTSVSLYRRGGGVYGSGAQSVRDGLR